MCRSFEPAQSLQCFEIGKPWTILLIPAGLICLGMVRPTSSVPGLNMFDPAFLT
jgi:hypothetical protein